MAPPRPGPNFGTTYQCGVPALLEEVLPLVDYIEVTPDSVASVKEGRIPRISRSSLAELREIAAHATVVVHGVGLSIGSYDGWNWDYIRLLDQIFEQISVAWHSEHLGFINVDGDFLGTMLTLPRTEETLDLVCERVLKLRSRYSAPFLLEHVAQLLPNDPAPYSHARFLNEVAGRSGCELIFDAYNLECDACNGVLDARQFLAELDFTKIREIHTAGGVKHAGFMLDVHSRLCSETTIEFAQEALLAARESVELVTYEILPEAVPVLGIEAVCNEIARLKRALIHPWTSQHSSANFVRL